MTEELKPCPFCGAKPHKQLGKVWYDALHGEPHQDTVIKCPHLCVKMAGSSDGVAARWNARTPEQIAADPRVKALVELLAESVGILRVYCPEDSERVWGLARQALAAFEKEENDDRG
jgi:hypothetical protein